MSEELDFQRVRGTSLAQLADYYKSLSNWTPQEDGTEGLLAGIERGSISPAAFDVWLDVFKSPYAIRAGLTQTFSISVRRSAIRQLCKSLQSFEWKRVWLGLGETAGLVAIFGNLSVHEIKMLCAGIGKCANISSTSEKQQAFEDLFKSLHPDYFPEAPHASTDERPLAKHYASMIPACTQGLIDQAIASGYTGFWEHVNARVLARNHAQSLQLEQIRLLESGKPTTRGLFESLLHKWPPIEGSEKGYSASMEYSEAVLNRLVVSDPPKADHRFLIDKLVCPLLQRALNKKIRTVRLKNLTGCVVQYLVKHKGILKQMKARVGDLLSTMIRIWSRSPEQFNGHLREMVSLANFSVHSPIDTWNIYLSKAHRSQRYLLLHLLHQEVTGLDINKDDDVVNIKGRLNLGILTLIPKDKALSLFNRVRQMRGDDWSVSSSGVHSIFNTSRQYHGNHGDPELFQIWLLCLNSQNERAIVLAQQHIAAQKKRSASSAMPEERGFYAKSAIYTAFASGSYNEIKEIMIWSKRFIRDPLAITYVYPSTYPTEAIERLAGIPHALNQHFTLQALHASVVSSNEILVDLFETACAAQQEPSFLPSQWHGVLCLFRSVVSVRIDLTSKLKRVLGASDNEMFEALWKSTIPMLCDVERQVHGQSAERLAAGGLAGILDYRAYSPMKWKFPDISTFRFVDELAQARDSLWSELRSENNPLIRDLPAPYPKGLPLQFLAASWKFEIKDLATTVPFLAERVKKTLFPDPQLALQVVPDDDWFRKAAGVFIDSYEHALHLYIPGTLSDSDQKSRKKELQEYAIGQLSGERMSQDEAHHFWTSKLSPLQRVNSWNKSMPLRVSHWRPFLTGSSDRAVWPLSRDPGSVEALPWNPLEVGKPQLSNRRLGPLTYLDMSIGIKASSYDTISTIPRFPDPEIPPNTAGVDTLWVSSSGQGDVLSAMLYIDAKCGSADDGLLRRPFPSERDAIYPALYLTDKFLEDYKKSILSAMPVIRRHSRTVPPRLLHRLTQNAIKALNTTSPKAAVFSELLKVTMQLIVALGESDRPSLAIELALNTVLSRRDVSSWHRHLLKVSFVHRLPAPEARACLEAFTERVIAKLQSQKRSSSEQTAELRGRTENLQKSIPAPSEDYLKVTTIKFLVELLQNTSIVSKDFAIKALANVCHKANHLDVTLSVVDHLLEFLTRASPQRADDTITILEQILPLAMNLNERKLMKEDDWRTAEAMQKLPDVPQVTVAERGESRTLLNAFVGQFLFMQESSYMEAYVKRIILPLAAGLQAQTSRWVSLFLLKHGIDSESQQRLEIPPVPRVVNLYEKLLSRAEEKTSLLPQWMFVAYIDRMIFNIAPPEAIKQLNERLKSDPKLNSQDDTKVWLYMYGEGTNAIAPHFPIFLGKTTKLDKDRGVPPYLVHEKFLELFRTLLWADAPFYSVIRNQFAQRLLDGFYFDTPWWPAHGRPLVQSMIDCVDELRTSEWIQNSERNPTVLPDTFTWRLLLLDHPRGTKNYTQELQNQKCELFANQIALVIEETSVGAYHDKLALFKNYLCPRGLSVSAMRNMLVVACHLGATVNDTDPTLPLTDILKVEIVSHIVHSVHNIEKTDPIVEEFKDMVGNWKKSPHEEIRRLALNLWSKDLSPSH